MHISDTTLTIARAVMWIAFVAGVIAITMLVALILEERSAGRDIDDERGES